MEFTDERRTVSAADPGRAAGAHPGPRPRGRSTPRVGLLSGAVLLGMRLVAAGKFEPADDACRAGGSRRSTPPTTTGWRCSPGPGATTALDGPEPAVVRAVLDAVADAMPRAPHARRSPGRRRAPRPVRPGGPSRRGAAPGFTDRLAGPARPAASRGRDEPPAAGPDLAARRGRRGGAGRRARSGSSCRSTTSSNPLHVCDAALLWTEQRPGRRARVRRPGPHPRHHRAARGGRGLAGARPAARAAGARPDHPRHRRAGEPARATAWAPSRSGASTCCGRAASAAT